MYRLPSDTTDVRFTRRGDDLEVKVEHRSLAEATTSKAYATWCNRCRHSEHGYCTGRRRVLHCGYAACGCAEKDHYSKLKEKVGS
jgi:hypothetical protein